MRSERIALVFDVFGTLVDWRGSIFERLHERAAAAAGAPEVDWAAFVDAWRAAYPPAMDRVRTGARAWADLDILHGEALDALLPEFGLPALAPAERAWFVRRWHELRPWPDVRAGLARLRATFVTATLSNGHLPLQIDLGEFGDLRFDALFSAATFGHYKPDPETYLGAARLLDRSPERVMLCASHPSDLAAARACGLLTALVRRPHEYGPVSRDGGAAGDGAAFDLEAGSLDELAEALERNFTKR